MNYNFDKYDWKEAIEYTKTFSKINTYELEGKIAILKIVEKIIRENTNADVKIYDLELEEPFIVAKLTAKNSNYKFLIEGHLDIVSPDGVENPFDAIIKNNIMYGRGVCDMKGGCGAILAAFIAASKEENIKGDLYLMFSTDEEYSGNQIKKALKNKYIPKCDFAMIAEPTNCSIATAHKGNAWMSVEFFGKSAHASTPHLGINAIYMASDFIHKLKEYIKVYENQKHEIYGTPTMNVGVIEGGSKPNVVSPYAKVYIDKRYLPDDNYENFNIEIQKIIDELKAENSNFNAKIEKIGDWPSVVVDRKDPIFLKVKKAVTIIHGKDLEISVMPFWGEGGFMQQFDIPVVYYGPGHPKFAHTPNEEINMDNIVLVAKGYYCAIKELCF